MNYRLYYLSSEQATPPRVLFVDVQVGGPQGAVVMVQQNFGFEGANGEWVAPSALLSIVKLEQTPEEVQG